MPSAWRWRRKCSLPTSIARATLLLITVPGCSSAMAASWKASRTKPVHSPARCSCRSSSCSTTTTAFPSTVKYTAGSRTIRRPVSRPTAGTSFVALMATMWPRWTAPLPRPSSKAMRRAANPRSSAARPSSAGARPTSRAPKPCTARRSALPKWPLRASSWAGKQRRSRFPLMCGAPGMRARVVRLPKRLGRKALPLMPATTLSWRPNTTVVWRATCRLAWRKRLPQPSPRYRPLVVRRPRVSHRKRRSRSLRA